MIAIKHSLHEHQCPDCGKVYKHDDVKCTHLQAKMLVCTKCREEQREFKAFRSKA